MALEDKALGVLAFQKKIKGGVRPNLFQVSHNFPGGLLVGTDLETFLCKSAALPASTVGTVELPFRGRVIKVPGDRTFESWTATFYMDDAFKLRGAYEKWIEFTNSVDANTASKSVGDILEDITVIQMDKFDGSASEKKYNKARSYTLVGAFPVSVSQVSLAYDNNDSYEEFDVEFAYQYFTTDDGDSLTRLKAVAEETTDNAGTGPTGG
tara:strand:- start:185 stop:814 length:630 start_codon:yes stop_codon:yes gene_type:complete